MELTPRLQAIADQVPQGVRFADVGTDHGYLPVWLLRNGKISAAIASDLREGPLNRARQTALQFGQTERISFRLCGGLAGIAPDEAEVIAIAGMGGETIAAILADAPWTHSDKLLLLQPMTGLPELRQWLQEHHYAIQQEQIVREGKRLYTVWTVKDGTMPPFTPAELWAGRQSRDPLRSDYLTWIIEKAEKALAGHQAAHTPDPSAISRLTLVLDGLKQMKEELEG